MTLRYHEQLDGKVILQEEIMDSKGYMKWQAIPIVKELPRGDSIVDDVNLFIDTVEVINNEPTIQYDEETKMKIINFGGFEDRFGMVSCNKVAEYPDAPTTENGLLFTAVAMQSLDLNNCFNHFHFEELFEACFINGILYRNPEPHPKPESHDNYTACALGSVLEWNTVIPRKLLWSLIKHFGYVNKEFVGRFPQVWLLLLVTSFPWLRYGLLPILYGLYLLQTPKSNPLADTSSTQLQFVIVSIIDILFPSFGFLATWKKKLKVSLYDVFSIYYSPEHPITQSWKV